MEASSWTRTKIAKYNTLGDELKMLCFGCPRTHNTRVANSELFSVPRACEKLYAKGV